METNEQPYAPTEINYTKLDNWTAKLFDRVLPIINILSILIVLIIIGGVFYELYSIVADPDKELEISDYVLKIIELLFLSSIPLLITTSFYKYYKKVIRSVFAPTKIGTDSNKTLETLNSALDVGIMKYNFYSILVSTGFIILFRRISELKSRDFEQSEIVIYSLMLGGIFILLVFIIFLKHSITDNAIKIIKETQANEDRYESKKHNNILADLNARIERLAQEKNKKDRELKEVIRKIEEKRSDAF